MDNLKKQLIEQLQRKIFVERDLKQLHLLAQTLERLIGDEVVQNK